MLFALLTVFCFYFIIRSFNQKIALLSLPLTVLIFSNVFITAFTWGNWPFFAGSALFVLFLWCLSRLNNNWDLALSALALSSVVFAHTSEFIFSFFVLGFLLLIEVFRLIVGRTSIEEIHEIVRRWRRHIGIAAGAVFIVIIYYLIIFGQSLIHDFGSIDKVLSPDAPGLGMFVKVTTPGIWLAITIAIGAIIGIFLLTKHRAIQYALVMLIIGFSNYFLTGKRGLETRYLWPVYLSILLGIVIYFLISNILKQKLSTRVCAIISIVLIALFAYNYYVEVSGPGLLSKESWEGMDWIGKATPENSTVLYVYGDAYNQAAVVFITRRIPDVILVEDYASMAQSNQLRRTIQTEHVFDHTGDVPYWTSWPIIGNYLKTGDFVGRGPSDLCGFDYYVLDKVSRAQGAAQYNMALAQHFQQRANFTKAYENPGVIILKNPAPGGDCLAQ